eukprot:9473566-Pyramimonas_sp.AAC.3
MYTKSDGKTCFVGCGSWAVGADGWIMRTFDAGLGWSQEGAGQTSVTLRGLNIPNLTAPEELWLAGDDNTVLRTYNDGRK